MNIILFGGTFDPVHRGHLYVAKKALQYKGRNSIKFDRVIFVPNKKNPLGKTPIATNQDRLNMLNLSIKDNDDFAVSEYELNKKGDSYTWETIEYFKSQDDIAKIALLLGADSFLTFKKWKCTEFIIENSLLYIYPRPGYNLEEVSLLLNDSFYSKVNYELIVDQGVSVSSTNIRNSVNENVATFTEQVVAEYIKKNRLYQDSK